MPLRPSILSLVAVCACACPLHASGADEATDAGTGGVETFPYIEAIEITPMGEFSDVRTIRTYRAGRGETMLVSSTAFVVPWSWGEKEIKAFCRPNLKVTEGELVDVTKDWWEEAKRTDYPCIVLGNKVMINRKIYNIRAERGIITTVETRRQPVREGATTIIPEEGDGERFVAVKLTGGDNALVSCGENVDSGSVDTGGGNERRWKVQPGREIAIQVYGIR